MSSQNGPNLTGQSGVGTLDRVTNERMTDAELQRALDDYDRERAEALERRDAKLQHARDTGWRPSEIERFTGMSREAVRQALNPAAREAARKALADRRAAEQAGKPS